METNLDKIKKISEEKKHENWEFRSFLKSCTISQKILDKTVRKLYKEAAAEIDCTTCGNCCRELCPSLNMEEVEKLSNSLGISSEQFEEKYLYKVDVEGEYMFKADPCPFHRDNKCMCYEHRPEVCISYPHLNKKRFTDRMIRLIDSCAICPIVFNVFEKLKDEVWYNRNIVYYRVERQSV